MKYALIDSNNIVVNIINYDGVSQYIPPFGQAVVEIEDWINIGDNPNKEVSPLLPEVYYQALEALDKSDITMNRIQEAISLELTSPTASDVISFVQYRRSLRTIIIDRDGVMPIKPPYPVGT